MSWRGARRSLLLSPLLVLGVLAGAWGQTAPVPGLDKLTPEEQATYRKLVAKMEFGIVVKRPAHVIPQFLIDRPTDHAAHCVKIKVKVERHVVIEAKTFVIKRIAADEGEAARENYQRLHKLSPEGRARVLQDFRRWNELPEERRQSLQKEYERFQQLTPERRDRIIQRYQQWESLSPEERDRVQRNQERWRQMSPEERERIRERWRQMPPDERERLREQRQHRSVQPPPAGTTPPGALR